MEFGGKNLTNLCYYSNILFTNGNVDPWSSDGVNSIITSNLPAILSTGGAHHLDLRAANKDDPEHVRQDIVALIQQWIL
jgi:lysosomal Pro-X carboxypeptidase